MQNSKISIDKEKDSQRDNPRNFDTRLDSVNSIKTLSTKHKSLASKDYDNMGNLGTQVYSKTKAQITTPNHFNKNNYITCPTTDANHEEKKFKVNTKKSSFSQFNNQVTKEKSKISIQGGQSGNIAFTGRDLYRGDSNKIYLNNYKSTSPQVKTTLTSKIGNNHIRTKSSTSRYELKSRDTNDNSHNRDSNINLNTNLNANLTNKISKMGSDLKGINLNININNNYNISNTPMNLQPLHQDNDYRIYLDKTPNTKKIKINSLNKNELNYIQDQLLKKLKTSQNDINTKFTSSNTFLFKTFL